VGEVVFWCCGVDGGLSGIEGVDDSVAAADSCSNPSKMAMNKQTNKQKNKIK